MPTSSFPDIEAVILDYKFHRISEKLFTLLETYAERPMQTSPIEQVLKT